MKPRSIQVPESVQLSKGSSVDVPGIGKIAMVATIDRRQCFVVDDQPVHHFNSRFPLYDAGMFCHFTPVEGRGSLVTLTFVPMTADEKKTAEHQWSAHVEATKRQQLAAAFC